MKLQDLTPLRPYDADAVIFRHNGETRWPTTRETIDTIRRLQRLHELDKLAGEDLALARGLCLPFAGTARPGVPHVSHEPLVLGADARCSVMAPDE